MTAPIPPSTKPHDKRHYQWPTYTSSRQCRDCGNDYLFPAYGGRVQCHDCMWGDE